MDEWVKVESSDKKWSTGEGNGKLLQYSCLENPMNNIERFNFVQILTNISYLHILFF